MCNGDQLNSRSARVDVYPRRHLGADVANSIEAPHSLGDRNALTSLFADAGIPAVHIDTIVGRAHFANLDAWLYTDIRGWKLASVIDEKDYARLTAATPDALSVFVQTDGSVTFDAPAHIDSFTA